MQQELDALRGELVRARALADWSRGRRLGQDDSRRDGLGAGRRLMSGARVESATGRGATVTAWKYF